MRWVWSSYRLATAYLAQGVRHLGDPACPFLSNNLSQFYRTHAEINAGRAKLAKPDCHDFPGIKLLPGSSSLLQSTDSSAADRFPLPRKSPEPVPLNCKSVAQTTACLRPQSGAAGETSDFTSLPALSKEPTWSRKERIPACEDPGAEGVVRRRDAHSKRCRGLPILFVLAGRKASAKNYQMTWLERRSPLVGAKNGTGMAGSGNSGSGVR